MLSIEMHAVKCEKEVLVGKCIPYNYLLLV